MYNKLVVCAMAKGMLINELGHKENIFAIMDELRGFVELATIRHLGIKQKKFVERIKKLFDNKVMTIGMVAEMYAIHEEIWIWMDKRFK